MANVRGLGWMRSTNLLGRVPAGVTALLHNRFARNWSFLVGSNLACQVLRMLATVRLARLLAPEGYGEYNMVQTVAALGAVVAALGLRNVMVRRCARQAAQSAGIFCASLMLRAGALALVVAGITVYGRVSSHGLPVSLAATASGLLVGTSIWDLIESVAFGHERMEYSSVINLAGSIVWVAMAWGAPAAWITPLNVSLAFAAVQCIKAAAYGLTMVRAGLFQGRADLARWRSTARSLLPESMPFYWLNLLTAATNQLPIMFLAERSGPAEVGLYNAGYRLVSPVQMLIMTALTALYPGLARAGATDGEEFNRTTRRALVGITVLGVGGAMVISLLRQEFVLLLFGAAYGAAADALAYQCWYSVLLAILSLMGIGLGARDRQTWLAALSTCYTVLATPLLWWGAGHGARGLAVATLGGAIVSLPYHWIVFQRSLPRPLSAPVTVGVAALVGGGLALSWAIPQSVPLLWRVTVAAATLALIPIAGVRVGLLQRGPAAAG